MKIALITENSQAAKNSTIHSALTAVAEPLGHDVFNYGMYTAEDKASLTYVMNGILTGILLNSKAADFVVTGCGTGMGSMLACNAMPGVFCGLVIDPTDAFLFAQINDGNAISMPYAKGFGWAAELNLQDVYRNHGQESRHPEIIEGRFVQGHGDGIEVGRSGSAQGRDRR